MGRSVVTQSSFLGGEWSPEAQGRIDRPEYRTAMKVCLNGIPVEAGAFVRRSGTEWLSFTYSRNPAKLIAFVPSSTTPYVVEHTAGNSRFYLGTSLVFTTDTPPQVSSATYSGTQFTLNLTAAGAIANGDNVMLDFSAGTLTAAQEAGLRNQVLNVVSGGGTASIVVGNDVAGSLTGYTLPTGGLVNAKVWRVARISNVFAASDLPNLRAVQAGNSQLILSGTNPPQILTQTAAPAAGFLSGIDDRLYMVTADTTLANYAVELLRPFLGQTDVLANGFFVDRGSAVRAVVEATFTSAAATFIDGPYLDPPINATTGVYETCTVSAGTGSITVTPQVTVPSANDIGRHIRMFSEPPLWASGTTYAAGALVKYNGAYYASSQGSNVGNTPGVTVFVSGVPTNFWNAVLNVQRMCWGVITANSGTTWTVTLTDASSNGGASGTIPTAANGTTCSQFQLGVFKTGQYPTNGTYHEGRLWLAGAVGNRFDAGMSNVLLQFSPTDQYANVNDNNAIGRTLNSTAVDQIFWMKPDVNGLLMGTIGGEILVSSGTSDDPLTPSNIKSRGMTTYGSAFIEPVRTGQALCFVQRYERRLMEYLASDFASTKFTAKHLNEFALHLSAAGIAEIAYNEEPTPILWCRMNDGSISGVTYRRLSRFATDNPVCNAWHRHVIGGP